MKDYLAFLLNVGEGKQQLNQNYVSYIIPETKIGAIMCLKETTRKMEVTIAQREKIMIDNSIIL